MPGTVSGFGYYKKSCSEHPYVSVLGDNVSFGMKIWNCWYRVVCDSFERALLNLFPQWLYHFTFPSKINESSDSSTLQMTSLLNLSHPGGVKQYLSVVFCFFFFLFFVFVVVSISWAPPAAYGGSPARG